MDDQILQEALLDARNGAAICFVGAGFSFGGKTRGGECVPEVSALSDEIWNIIGGDKIEGASLSDLAEFCEQKVETKNALIDLMIDLYTDCVPSKEHKIIMDIPWRAVFTTNFDDIVESCKPDSQVVTPVFSVEKLNPRLKPVYHLHGYARDLVSRSLDPGIVLSETSYLQIRARNKDLYSALENEIYTASRVFFIGYSLRDAEIASMLFSIPSLRNKSIVVTAVDDSHFATSRLSKFGNVFRIGISGLSSQIEKLENSVGASVSSDERLNFVQRVFAEKMSDSVNSDDVNRLILSGEFTASAYARQVSGENPGDLYCVSRREHVEKIFSLLGKGANRFLVSSDLGNGKSTFLHEVIYAAHQRGYEAIRVNSTIHEAYAELERLFEDGRRRIYIVDDFVRYRSVVKFIGSRLPPSSALITASGSLTDNREFSDLSGELGGTLREIDINILSKTELADWDRFLERWGFWEGRIEESIDDRLKFLEKRCNSENRSIVVSLFRTSALSEKINRIVQFFITQNKNLSTPFIAILINSICNNHVEWNRIVRWLEIDEDNLKSAIFRSNVVDFMSGSRQWYNITSSELADFILNNYDFDVNEIVDIYVKIVKETAFSANDPRSGFDSRENLKELMRFRFLTRLFSNADQGSRTINAVYHRLSSVPRIRANDQFWLQYAMARMEIGDLENAETYINTALGIASKKGYEYSVRQIVDQKARLLLRKNSSLSRAYSRSDVSEAVSYLVNAMNSSDGIVTHSLRSSSDILSFIEAKIDDISAETQDELKQCLKLMDSKIPSSGNLPRSQKGETKKIRADISSGLMILANY